MWRIVLEERVRRDLNETPRKPGDPGEVSRPLTHAEYRLMKLGMLN